MKHKTFDAENEKFFSKEVISVYLAPCLESGLKIAQQNLRNDLEKIFTKKVEVTDITSAELVVGTLADFPDESLNYLDCAPLFEQQKLISEAYLIAEKSGQIFIVGADFRGSIFGIYEFTKRIGVSPWYFFADVPLKKKDSFVLPKDFYFTEHPSVSYRGIFINDEEELNNWAKAHTKDGTIGPETYVKIYELLLRLKANYLWPAMHVNYFNENTENGRLANEMGIIIGTSHCDMLLRSNQNEWGPWLETKNYSPNDVQYDYSISGRNREILQEYWQESVELNKDYDVSYTVGMRGIHDSGFITKMIDQDEKLSPDEKIFQKKEMLQQIINDQRTIIQETLDKKPSEVLQTFIPYKEVLKYYDEGLKIPEDITIIWTNDNYGNVRRYPSLEDQKRLGGHGLYYHSSYWAATTMHYLFISSTPLAKMKNELKKAWQNGIQKMWVLNVGALKPLEQDVEFFLRYAFEVGKERTTQSVETFLNQWIDENFSGHLGSQVGPLLNEFTQVTNVRKIEQMDDDTFTQNKYGDEGFDRLNRLQEIFSSVNQLARQLPTEEQAAFFQLVQMKIHAAYYKSGEYYYADRSALSFKQGKMQSATEYHRRSGEFTNYLRWMIHYYNNVMMDGKWAQILTPELAPPPNMRMYPTTKPALSLNEPKLNFTLWHETAKKALELEKNSANLAWFEIFNEGYGEFTYQITCPDWLVLSKYTGQLRSEERIFIEKVFPTEKSLSGSIIVTTSTAGSVEIPVHLLEKTSDRQLTLGTVVEADNYLAFSATDFQKNSSQNNNQWEIVPNLGRYQGAALQATSQKQTALSVEHVQQNPSIEYSLNFKTAGTHLIEFYRLPSLNSVGKIRFAIALDDHPVQIISSDVTDEHRGNWEKSVLNDVDKLYGRLPFVAAGSHKLTLYMIDSYVALSKIVIYTDKFYPTNLGPRLSHTIGQVSKMTPELQPANKIDYIEQLTQMYHSSFNEVSLPEILYVDQHYYQQPLFSAHLVREKQTKLADPAEQLNVNEKNSLITQFRQQKIVEKNNTLAFEAELVLAENENYYTTENLPNTPTGCWEHLGTPTNRGMGLGMYIPGSDTRWPEGTGAPELHYTLQVTNPGKYAVWILLKYEAKGGDSVLVGLDGQVQSLTQQNSPKGFFSYLNQQIWHWNLVSEIELHAGINDFTIYGRSAGVKIDRLFLNSDGQRPPLDADFQITRL